MTKVSELSLEDFIKNVTASNPTLVASVKDATKVIKDTYEEKSKI